MTAQQADFDRAIALVQKVFQISDARAHLLVQQWTNWSTVGNLIQLIDNGWIVLQDDSLRVDELAKDYIIPTTRVKDKVFEEYPFHRLERTGYALRHDNGDVVNIWSFENPDQVTPQEIRQGYEAIRGALDALRREKQEQYEEFVKLRQSSEFIRRYGEV